MTRIRLLLPFCIFLLLAGTAGYTAPQKIQKKGSKPDIQVPDMKLVVPTWTDHTDTLPMDLMQVAYTPPPPAIPMEESFKEDYKNRKGVVIVPAPPPPPGNGYVPKKYPDRKPKD